MSHNSDLVRHGSGVRGVDPAEGEGGNGHVFPRCYYNQLSRLSNALPAQDYLCLVAKGRCERGRQGGRWEEREDAAGCLACLAGGAREAGHFLSSAVIIIS